VIFKWSAIDAQDENDYLRVENRQAGNVHVVFDQPDYESGDSASLLA
jgi:hypothetical protein